MIRSGVTLLVFLAAAGCGGLPPAPTIPDPSALRGARSEPPPGMDPGDPEAMRLYPGDVLTVTSVSAETTVLEDVVVDGAGRIHIPLAGDVEVGGVELTEAEARLEEALQRFDRFVRVNVHVSEPAGHRATVLGAVMEPGAVSIGQGDRIADLVAAAGGPRTEVTQEGSYVELADLDGAKVYRDGTELPISVRLALEGSPRHNVRARPGDHVHIPPSTAPGVTVVGHVNEAGVFRHQRGLRVTDALAMAGGSAELADEGDIRLVRGGPSEPQVYAVNIDDIRDGDGHDVVLAPGDIVYVPESAAGPAGRVMSILAPIIAAGVSVLVAVLIIEGNSR